MLFDDLGESARTLLRARARAIGDGLTALARDYASWSANDLADELARASREQKPALGLLLARVALEDAVGARSRELFARFLFRFGAHLKTSVSTPGQTPAQRLALATATETLFDALPTSSNGQRADASSIRRRLEGPTVAERDWQTTIGIPRVEFDRIIAQFERELGGRQKLEARTDSRQTRRAPRSATVRELPVHPVPNWLSLTLSNDPDPLVAATASWQLDDANGHDTSSLGAAWSAFCEGKYGLARSELEGQLARLSDGYGPTSSADALRSWNWIRLVAELAAIDSGETADSRRSWTTVCELAQKCVPDSDKLEDWIANAIGDFVAGDLASKRAWGAYTVRLVSTMTHETALSVYSNHEKALVRETWAELFGLSAVETRSTASAAASVAPRYRQATQKLYLGARQDQSPARVLREVSHELPALLDELEGGLFSEALDLTQEVERLITLDDTNHRDLQDLKIELKTMRIRIATSGSALLQDFVAPVLFRSDALVQRAAARLGDISRPEVSVALSSSKIPFSAAAGSTYQIRFTAMNAGNAIAEAISLRVVESELGIDAIVRLDTLGPGAQTEVNVPVVASGRSRKAVVLTCSIQWTDAHLQQFSITQMLSAEDQMDVAWSPNDVNPFSLGTISEPGRLVGRADDLASLDALLAGNASAYVTGHKRVGKTSLIRVLLRSTRENRGWAGSLLPLGRALGQDQSAADLVYALLDEILDAARDAYGDALSGIDEVGVDRGGNFARAANKWLRSLARALPTNARVVVAVDDFDELPPHLVEGSQADALFLFLRSLVDEPWLNLIVVGSEVLPSIIQAQAHKLNQVVPISVTNFSSRASTAELLETPTTDRLEWMDDALDRVHYLCAGNPYYETLLAQRLWQTMRERSRSVVTAGDIDEAAASVAREASDSHFIHLWADSSSGLDHTARGAIVASAVLRSIARCGGESLAPAAPDEVTHLAQSWIQTATSEELMQAIAALRAREVVRSGPSESRLLISIPLVGVWLQSAGGRALDGVYATSKHATATVRMITDSDLVTLARNLRYRGEQVTEIRLKAWLEQFGGNDRQYLAYKMLRRMILDGYFTMTRLQNTELPRLASAVHKLSAARLLTREANNQNLRNAYLVSHGVAGDSTQGTLAVLAKALKIKKANIIRVDELAERLKSNKSDVVLFLLDDYCGTGTHLAKELDSVTEAVLAMGEDWVDRVHVVVGASVVADEADLPNNTGPLSVEVVGGTFLGERFRPFSPESGVFDSAKEREDAEEMVTSIGKALVPNNPLGFGGKALLTLFEFNCPNNVAPVFWRSGLVSGGQWIPLFERSV